MDRKLKVPSKLEDKKIEKGILNDPDTSKQATKSSPTPSRPRTYYPPVRIKRLPGAGGDKEDHRMQRSKNR